MSVRIRETTLLGQDGLDLLLPDRRSRFCPKPSTDSAEIKAVDVDSNKFVEFLREKSAVPCYLGRDKLIVTEVIIHG